MSGKATAISKEQASRIKRAFLNKNHRLIFAIAWFTTERWGAVLKLKVGHVYRDPGKREPNQAILIPARIRKDRKTRQVEVHQDLETELRAFQPPLDPEAYLFPSPLRAGEPLSYKSASDALSRACFRAGLDGMGITTHSTRRGSITTLARAGIHQRVIQDITGHSNASVLAGYIEVSEEQRKAAIATL
jgi:integrase/recombinase XerD